MITDEREDGEFSSEREESPEVELISETRRRVRETRRRGERINSDPTFRPSNPRDFWDEMTEKLASSLLEKASQATKKSRKRNSMEMESGYTSEEDDEKLPLQSGKDHKDWKDDGEKVISAKMRMIFARRPNADPEDWWNKTFSGPVMPKLSNTLSYEHLIFNRVNKDTIAACHDGRTNPEIKAWSHDNSGYGRQMSKIYKMQGTKDGVALKSGAELKELATIWIIVDSLWNQVAIFSQVR